jgi:hypothetical protein
LIQTGHGSDRQVPSTLLETIRSAPSRQACSNTVGVAAAIRCTLQGVCGAAQAKSSRGNGKTGAIGQIDQLAATGCTVESITADVLLVNSEHLERVDRMTTKAEARRNAALHEIERRRSSMAQALRRASDDVVEAEFVDVAPDQIARKEVKLADASEAHRAPSR